MKGNLRKNYFFFFLILLVCTITLLKFFIIFTFPLDADTAGYSQMAKIILQGKSPYVDFFDHKSPLTYYILIPFFLTFGVSTTTAFFTSFIIFLALLLVLFFIVKKRFGIEQAIVAVVFMAILSIEPGYSNEVLMVLFGLLGLYFYSLAFDKKKGNFYFLLSGLFIALAVWVKQPGVFFFFAIFIHQVVEVFRKKITFKTSLKHLYLVISGIFILTIPLLSYFLYLIGWDALFFSLIKFNTSFAGATSRILQVGRLFELLAPFWILFALIIFKFKSLARKSAFESVSLIFLVVSVLFFMTNREVYFHHLVQIFPFMIILTISSLKEFDTSKIKPLVNLFVCLFLVALFITSLAATSRLYRAAHFDNQNEILDYIDNLNSTNIFTTSTVFYFLSDIECDYNGCFIATSTSSVFDYSDFCTYVLKKEYLVLKETKKHLGEENLKCIAKNFELIQRFENKKEKFVEIWRKKEDKSK